MSKRVGRALAALLLLFTTCVTGMSASGQGQLVMLRYAGLEGLRALAGQGLQILNYGGGFVAGLADERLIAALMSSGHGVRVLDTAPELSLYYLAYPLPAGDPADLCAAQAVYVYRRDAYLVRASPGEAALLASRGIDLVKLPPAVLLPPSGPALTALAAPPAVSSVVETMISAVSAARLTHDICKLQDDDSQAYCNPLGSRWTFAVGKLNEAAEYLYEQYTAMGLSVTYDAFVHGGTPMNNVVAELPGMGPHSEEVYILCAHYDSISDDPLRAIAPGADDNGSGTAAVLEAARILSNYRLCHTLRFVHFAAEEVGLIGSQDYATKAFRRGDRIKGVINLDMIGYESVPPGDHIVEIHAGIDPSSIALADVFMENIARYGLALQPQKLTSGATDRSDHGSFWTFAYPAMLGIEDFDDFNVHYHKMSDTVDRLQMPLVIEYTKACLATLVQLAMLYDPRQATPTPTATPEYGLFLPILVRL